MSTFTKHSYNDLFDKVNLMIKKLITLFESQYLWEFSTKKGCFHTQNYPTLKCLVATISFDQMGWALMLTYSIVIKLPIPFVALLDYAFLPLHTRNTPFYALTYSFVASLVSFYSCRF
jgi:hypothetical protein